MLVVDLVQVSKTFGAVQAVRDCSFGVASGEIVSLLGPSGCGKTTILRMIAGFETPSAGHILISGQDMLDRRPYERKVGIVFQDYALFPHLSVQQNVGYGLRYRGYNAAQAKERVEAMLSLVHLKGYETRRPLQLSGGQQQRVALARALATNPDLVLLDEPLSALDAKLRLELQVELKEVLSKVGAAVIVVTHDQEEAMSLGDKVVVMNSGRIEQIDTPAAVYDRPATRFVAEFVGRSNWFSGTAKSVSVDGIATVGCMEGFSLFAAGRDIQQGRRYDICVRPERIKVHRGSSASSQQSNTTSVRAKIVERMYLGSDLSTVTELPSGRRILIIEKNLGQPEYSVGTDIEVSFHASDCIVVPAANEPPQSEGKI